MGYMEGGWHQTFAPGKKDICPKNGHFCPKICNPGHIQALLAHLVSCWLVGGRAARAPLSIERLPSLLYFNFPIYHNLALRCWLLLCILKAFMVLKTSQAAFPRPVKQSVYNALWFYAILIHVLTWISFRRYRKGGRCWQCGWLQCEFLYLTIGPLFHIHYMQMLLLSLSP